MRLADQVPVIVHALYNGHDGLDRRGDSHHSPRPVSLPSVTWPLHVNRSADGLQIQLRMCAYLWARRATRV